MTSRRSRLCERNNQMSDLDGTSMTPCLRFCSVASRCRLECLDSSCARRCSQRTGRPWWPWWAWWARGRDARDAVRPVVGLAAGRRGAAGRPGCAPVPRPAARVLGRAVFRPPQTGAAPEGAERTRAPAQRSNSNSINRLAPLSLARAKLFDGEGEGHLHLLLARTRPISSH